MTATEPRPAATAADCSTVPPSIMSASRAELDDLPLNLVAGELPPDLTGHVFIVAPVGSVNTDGLPYINGDALLNGDGMVYRLDFDRPGEARAKTRLVKPAGYYADLATQPGRAYEQYQFHNHGISRFSFSLGIRNQLNTAFLPMQFGDAAPRLLVTYDAGRPYEIDTESLETITPIGSNQEWQGELDHLKVPFLDASKFPCKSILSTAHPGFDYATGEMFAVNYGRSFTNLLLTIPWLHRIDSLPDPLRTALSWLLVILGALLDLRLAQRFAAWLTRILGDRWAWLARLLAAALGFLPWLLARLLNRELTDFTYLIRWPGDGNLERWQLMQVDADGTRQPVRIEQTIHQIGVTRDYIVIMDTAFIAGFEQIVTNPSPAQRRFLEGPPLPDSRVYLIRRADLQAGAQPARGDRPVEVVVQPVTIPLEAAHFLVDYENPDDIVTMHVAHLCGMQVAEWVRSYDSRVQDGAPVPDYLHGMEHDETDLGRMGRYQIHAPSGDIVSAQVIADNECTWAVDLYAYRDRQPDGQPLPRLENVYWGSFGLWRDLMTEYITNLYRHYKYRLIPLEQVIELATAGRPACIFRLHTESMTIADRYAFPCNHLALSPQFVPRPESQSDTDGYLVCTVCFDERNEVWIFDAAQLHQGPLCRLHHPELNFGFTLHTAWLPQIGRRQASYAIAVEADYEPLVAQNSADIQALFATEVYPYCS